MANHMEQVGFLREKAKQLRTLAVSSPPVVREQLLAMAAEIDSHADQLEKDS